MQHFVAFCHRLFVANPVECSKQLGWCLHAVELMHIDGVNLPRSLKRRVYKGSGLGLRIRRTCAQPWIQTGLVKVLQMLRSLALARILWPGRSGSISRFNCSDVLAECLILLRLCRCRSYFALAANPADAHDARCHCAGNPPDAHDARVWLLTLVELRGLLSKKTSCGCRPGLSRNSHTHSYSRTVPCKMRYRLEPIPPRRLPLMKIALLWRGLLVGVADNSPTDSPNSRCIYIYIYIYIYVCAGIEHYTKIYYTCVT